MEAKEQACCMWGGWNKTYMDGEGYGHGIGSGRQEMWVKGKWQSLGSNMICSKAVIHPIGWMEHYCSVTIMSDSAIPWTIACQASLSFITSQSLFKLMPIESVMSSNHLVLCHLLLLPPSIFHSIKVFPMSWLFTSCGQSIGGSASASVLPKNIQSGLPLGWTGLISLLSTVGLYSWELYDNTVF